jgi:hypothetical protein
VSSEELRRDPSGHAEVRRARRDWTGPGPRLSVAVLIVIALVTYLWLLNDAQGHHAELVDEFAMIQVPAGASQVGAPLDVVKPFSVLHGVSYRSTLQPAGVIDYYAGELKRLGWQDAGSIVNGSTTTRCFDKAEGLQASVTPLVDAPAGSFVVDLTWGGRACSGPQ